MIKKQESKRKFPWHRAIAIYEIIGGGLGILIVLILIVGVAPQLFLSEFSLGKKLAFVGIYVLSLAIYVFFLFAGIFLFKKQKRGLVMSLISQALQVPYLVIGGFTYTFVAGLQMMIKATGHSFAGNFFVGSTFNLGFGFSEEPFVVGINLVAVALLLYFFKIYQSKQFS